jgi:hypothetical protein
MRASLVILAARVDRDLDFVVTGMLDGEQDASIRFVGDPPQQLGLLVVLLGEANLRYRMARGLLMAVPAATRVADPARRGCRRNPECRTERHALADRSGGAALERYLPRRPATSPRRC